MHNRYRKIQYATVVIVFIALSVFSVFASMAFHKILMGADRVPQLYPIRECIKSIVTVEKHRLLFLCLVGISLCLSVSILVSYSRNYMSKLQQITLDIYTPVAVGQNQHGSAKWMKEKVKSKTFKTMVLDPNNKTYEMLIKAGKVDRAAIKLHVMDDEEGENKRQHIALYKRIQPVLKILLNKVYSNEKQAKLHKSYEQFIDDFKKKYMPGIWEKEKEQQIESLVGAFDDELFIDEFLDEFQSSLENDSNNGSEDKTETKIVKAAVEEPLTKEISKEKNEFEKLNHSPQIKKGGIVVGMKKMRGGKELHYFIDDDTHTLCIGATRSGKSRTLVIQSICNLGLAGENQRKFLHSSTYNIESIYIKLHQCNDKQ